MNKFTPLLGSATFGMIFFSQSVLADVTPGDVWQDWRDYMQGMGYGLTATENISGDTLAVSDVQMDLVQDADKGEVSVSLGTLSFVQNADGTVSVVMPDALPVVIDVTPTGPQAKPVRMSLTLTQSGQDMTISGTPANMTSTYAADTMGLTLDQLMVDNETFDASNAMFTLLLKDVQNTTETTLSGMRDYAQTSTVGSATYEMRFKNPEEPAVATISGTSSDLRLKAGGVLPLGLAQVGDMAALLKAGMDVAGTISGGNSTLTLDVEDPKNGNMAAAFASQSSTLKVETSADGLSYAGTRQGMTASIQPPEFPFLLSFAMDSAAFNLSAPVMKSDDPQDFALGLNLNDFTLSDMIWGMINPQETLPRDPASLALDLTGKVTLLTDYFDPNATAQMAEDGNLPGNLESVALNSLIVDALGAKLTGNGQATFDNAAADAAPGTLSPVGAIDLKLVGGNKLLETLTNSGLLPPQAAMGARMMMGMFAVPAEAEDTLTSKLEFTRSGAILANGQRIK